MKTYLLALLIFPVVVAVSWRPHAGDASNPAHKMASVISTILPKDLGGGNEFRSAVAEGDVLVLTIAMPSSSILSGTEMSKVTGASFCQSPGGRRYVEDGGKLRLDIAMGGEAPVHGVPIENCPGA